MHFAKATGITFLTSLVINLCNIFTGIATARLLQPEGRGELATIIRLAFSPGGSGLVRGELGSGPRGGGST